MEISKYTQQLQNAFDNILNSESLKVATGENPFIDKPLIRMYINNVQDSIIKDLPPRLNDVEVLEISEALENYNCNLQSQIK